MYWNKFFRCAAEILENTGVIEKNQVFTGVSFSCPPKITEWTELHFLPKSMKGEDYLDFIKTKAEPDLLQ